MQPNARTVARQERVLTSPGSHALESSRREHGAKTKSENIITVKKLAKSFGKVKAVRGVSFARQEGRDMWTSQAKRSR
jgi:hypothetical protein